VEEARKEVLSNIASRSNVPDSLAPSNNDESSDEGGESVAWGIEPEPEPDDSTETEQQAEEDAAAEVLDEGAPPRWLLRTYGSPVVQGHALTDPEFDSLRVVVRPCTPARLRVVAVCPICSLVVLREAAWM
jgi:hypothetical protein